MEIAVSDILKESNVSRVYKIFKLLSSSYLVGLCIKIHIRGGLSQGFLLGGDHKIFYRGGTIARFVLEGTSNEGLR